jgi:hypothetical protein
LRQPVVEFRGASSIGHHRRSSDSSLIDRLGRSRGVGDELQIEVAGRHAQ